MLSSGDNKKNQEFDLKNKTLEPQIISQFNDFKIVYEMYYSTKNGLVSDSV